MTFKKKLFVYLFSIYYIFIIIIINFFFMGGGILMRSVKLCDYVERGGNKVSQVRQ